MLTVVARSVEAAFTVVDGLIYVEEHTCDLSDGSTITVEARTLSYQPGTYGFFYSLVPLINGDGGETMTPFMTTPASGSIFDVFSVSESHAHLGSVIVPEAE